MKHSNIAISFYYFMLFGIVVSMSSYCENIGSQNEQWFKTIKNNGMFRFNYHAINELLQSAKQMAVKYKGKKYKFLITDDEALHLNGIVRKKSIDEVDVKLIQESLFFVFFHTDDDYCYTIRKIKDNGGIFYSLPHSGKTRYIWVDKNAMRAVDNAFSFGEKISHRNVDVHETICMCIDATKNLPGDYVEIGVYMGGSALTALSYMNYATISRKAYLLDTFNGMTYEEAHQSSDVVWDDTHILWGVEQTMKHVDGLLKTTHQNYKLVESNICKDNLPQEIKQIAVCNLDVDLYDATLAALTKVAPLVVKGGIIICEDPTSTPLLCGALLAMEEFLMTTEGKKFTKILLSHAQYLLIKME